MPCERVRGWWRLAPADSAESVGARLARFRTLLTLLMAVVGAAAGVTVALAAFHYDGSQPVNVVRLIALLVGLQLLFLLFTLLLIPGRVIGLRGLQDLVATITPGALAVSIFRRLARPPPELARLFDWHAARASAGRFAKWQLLCWSQVAAVAFNVAALATAIALVTFTDLAFGWSTTLQTDPATVSRIVQRDRVAVACDRAERRSYARAHRAVAVFSARGRRGVPDDASRALGGWWPFTIFAIVTYGLLPRLALLAIANVRLRAATTALLLEDSRRERAAHAHGRRPRSRRRLPTTTKRARASGASAPPVQREITGAAHAVIWEGSLAPERRAGIRAPAARPRRDGGGRGRRQPRACSRPRGARATRAAAARERSSSSRRRGSRRCSSFSIFSPSCGAASVPGPRSS